MTQEDKELLLKDLCARLPYGVMVREDTVLYDDKNTTSYRVKKLSYVQIGKGFSRIKGFIHDYEYIYIPYLFPMSNLTKRQHDTLYQMTECDRIDWLNAHYIDYRRLIEKGLAIDATGLNIY